jgi:predicted enzyme related to lactoylglutathione lyase
MPRVIHFEIVADNPERAMKFYKEVFGWEFNKWDGPQDYWLVKTGEDSQPGINGGLTPKTNEGSGNTGGRITNSIDVPSIDEFSNKISMEGGKVLSPKMPIPGVGYLAICEDTEGITFGIIQYDRNAK